MSLLTVENLTLQFDTDEGRITAVENVSFAINAGEVLGLVGESGSGKSVTAKSLMQLNPENSVYSPESNIQLELESGTVDVLSLKKSQEMVVVRGGAISMIFQEPMSSLNPVLTIGQQISEALILHQGMTKAEALARSVEMLDLVRIPEPAQRVREYPHQLSGGMRQRAMIAMALSCNPKLLIADEPTTALDVTIQSQVLQLLRQLKQEAGLTVLLITHDLGVVAELCDRVAVMYLGHIVEVAPAEDLYSHPLHPYTQALLSAVPIPDPAIEANRKRIILKGEVPSPLNPPSGCVFHPRCPIADASCESAVPELIEISPEHWVACFKA